MRIASRSPSPGLNQRARRTRSNASSCTISCRENASSAASMKPSARWANPSRNAIPLHDFLVRLVAQPGPLGQRDGAIGIGIDAAAPKAGGAVHVEFLDEAAVIAQRQEL